jgi:exodeoxyribonuclease VII small subunit
MLWIAAVAVNCGPPGIMNNMSKKIQSPPKNFEAALEELEKILAEIEGGGVGLEENLLRYERGTFLIQHCRSVLNGAEKQIELLSKMPDGALRADPMDEAPE